MTTSRSAFTIVELAVTAALLSISLWILGGIFTSANGAVRTGTDRMEIETNGSRTMRRIVDALRAADVGSIAALPSPPFSADTIDFQVVGIYRDQDVIVSGPRRIDIDPDLRSVRWSENPGLGSTLTTYWSSGVTDLLEGELLNGLDDNGNGLIDEAGLCFTREDALVTVRLTLQEDQGDGTPMTRTWTTRVSCRN